ncbi:MAG TPA: L-glutamate gamma-semialdehyde dehydrogenase, partial [Ktedonobacteraceae bacterium]|nr:L-glutamate gamma-semialdehyde dehydrogenase [Ktedonobacteraceae bacterium]
MAQTIESVASRAQTPFKNAALIDYSKTENRQAQMQALEQVKSELGQTYPLIIGGKKITNEATFASVNPSQPDQVIGYFARATVEQVNEAVHAASAAFESW